MPAKTKTPVKQSAAKSPDFHAGHPDHGVHLKRLRKVKGQLEGIEKMIVDKRYCTDIINQMKAASAALKAVEAEIFKTHLRGCVKAAISSKDPVAVEEKIQEIMKIIF